MKKICSICIIAACASANAQVNMGLKAGLSIPNIKGNTAQSKGYTSRKAFYCGLTANFKLTPVISIQPELNFSPQGGKRDGMQPVPASALSNIDLPEGTTLYANYKTKTILNYLEIPVLCKFTFGKKLKYFIDAGPYISFLIQSKTKTSGESNIYLDEKGTLPLSENGIPLFPYSLSGTTDINGSIRNINGGIEGGLGLQYFLGSFDLYLEGRGVIGLTNIQSHPDTDGKNKTGCFVIAAGFMVPIE